MDKRLLFLAIPFGLVALFLFASYFISYTPNPLSTPPTPLPPSPTVEEILITSEPNQEAPEWQSKLPLQNDKYFIFYDVNKKVLTGVLYPDSYAATSIDDQVAALKAEILPQLHTLGINTDIYPVTWQVTPVP